VIMKGIPPHLFSRLRDLALRTALRASSGESGQTLVEYSLVVTIMAIALLATLTIVGIDINDFYVSVGNAVADTLP
jgi:Flp pilus assembly pilin Flp